MPLTLIGKLKIAEKRTKQDALTVYFVARDPSTRKSSGGLRSQSQRKP